VLITQAAAAVDAEESHSDAISEKASERMLKMAEKLQPFLSPKGD